jgi:Reverse transcriptase (RNA-dependent DNA polymerase)
MSRSAIFSHVPAVVPQPQVAIVAAPNVPAPAANAPVVQAAAPTAAPTTTIDPKVASELNRLDANIADVDVSQGRTLRSGREIGHLTIDDLALFTVVNRGSMFPDFALKSFDPTNLKPAQYKDFLEVPTNFNDAWNHPCEIQRKLWREAIGVELAKMMTYKVWRKVKRHLNPNNRKCVKCKWVFNIKRNGVFQARLVACGTSQTPGIDFQESYSPVVNDTIWRMILVLQIALKLGSRIIDIETAFLNGELSEEIYMDAPEGLDAAEDEFVLLLKSLYGLIQSAQQFYLKFKEVMIKLAFKPSEIEPCLFSHYRGGLR